ncbi:MAG: quinoprotein [Verrucomicrobiaceae bacterium]|nr:quinoprotein [Verrucomicrobiaceae bacterium]
MCLRKITIGALLKYKLRPATRYHHPRMHLPAMKQVTAHPCHRSAWPVRLCLLLIALAGTSASATDLSSLKLFGHSAAGINPADSYMGFDLHCSDLSPKWAVVGGDGFHERGLPHEGAVQVFNAVTGTWMRKLLPPGPAAGNQAFGDAVAISGDLLLVGAWQTTASGHDHLGAAYLFNLATGALLKTFTPSNIVAGANYGFKVAISGNTAIIGAFGDLNGEGSVYLYNLTTGQQLAILVPSDGAPGDNFGYGLAVEGNILAVGSMFNNASRGAVYFYDISKPATPALVQKYQPASFQAGYQLGATVAMHQGRVVIGSWFTDQVAVYDLATGFATLLPLPPGGGGGSFGFNVALNGLLIAVGQRDSGNGKVHLYSSAGSYLSTLLAPSGGNGGQRFGTSIALSGTALLATAPNEGTLASGAGAAYLIRPLTQGMPYSKVVQKGEYAPGAANISYGAFAEAFAIPAGAGPALFTVPLTGAGSNAGKDTAPFIGFNTQGVEELVHKSRDPYGLAGVSYGAFSRITGNDYQCAIGLSTLTGTGISASNNLVLWYKTNSAAGTLLRTGAPVTEFSGAPLATVPEFVASNKGGEQRVGAFCTLKTGGTVTAANDSGIWLATLSTPAYEVVREGKTTTVVPSTTGTTLGQFAPRLCYQYTKQVFSTALTGPAGFGITPANNAAVFTRSPGDADVTLVAQKNDQAVDTAGAALGSARYAAFIGESSNTFNSVDYRATLSGLAADVNTTNNEGIWRLNDAAVHRLILRKGQTTGLPAGVKIAKLVSFWEMNGTTEQTLALVQLSGTGVAAANDQALLLSQTDGSLNLLMREGDAAPGCPGATIGVISRVDADAYANSYALVVTLAGAPLGTELALYTGNINRGNTTTQAALRRPFLRLRKGQLFDNQPGKVQSFSLPTSSVTPSGAGGTGRSHSIAWTGVFAFIVQFDNGVQQIVNGGVQ